MEVRAGDTKLQPMARLPWRNVKSMATQWLEILLRLRHQSIEFLKRAGTAEFSNTPALPESYLPAGF
jgi:hypothetical protein